MSRGDKQKRKDLKKKKKEMEMPSHWEKTELFNGNCCFPEYPISHAIEGSYIYSKQASIDPNLKMCPAVVDFDVQIWSEVANLIHVCISKFISNKDKSIK